MKTTEKIIAAIKKQKSLDQYINNPKNYMSYESFIKECLQYIKAIKERRMVCHIHRVSSSGMSRTLAFHSCEKNRKTNDFWYSNYFSLFTALGYTRAGDVFRVHGCGMDMVFHTNYSNIHTFEGLGIINKKQCERLAQMTPTVL